MVGVLNRQEGALRRVVANTGARLPGAHGARRTAARPRAQLAAGVRGHRVARPGPAGRGRRACPASSASRAGPCAGSRASSSTRTRSCGSSAPAARELAPTLRDLTAVAPDLRALFEALGPLITASASGFPAAEQTLRELRPLLAQFDPLGRQLNPALDFVGLYKGELTSFLGNAVAATQATTSANGRLVHYLRTTNPLNPENLAVYPRRIGTNRPNAYAAPGTGALLAQGVPSFETRHCATPGIPILTDEPPSPDAPPPLNEAFFGEILRFGFPAGNTGTGVAPPCRPQAAFTIDGETSLYPHVRAR